MDSKDCMLHRCEMCPGVEPLQTFLNDAFKDYDPEETIECKQWVHTDRDTLNMRQLQTEDFTAELVANITNLSSHHYISKQQSSYLKVTKNGLKPVKLLF